MLSLNCPTLAVINGAAIAGGVIFSVVHDYRIMSKQANIQLSEISVDLSFLPAYSTILEECFGRNTF